MARLAPPVNTGTETANRVREVVPHDDNDLPDGPCAALWVGGAGAVEIIARDDGVAVTISAVAAGTLLPIAARRVLAGNTDATLILALYNN